MEDKSITMQDYFASLDKYVQEAYAVAERARQKGFDPEPHVGIPLAKNMAERVEGIVSVAAAQLKGSGVSQRIIDLEKEMGTQNWKIAFIIALEVAQQQFCPFKDIRTAMEVGLRIGLAYITNGVVASPLEGFVRLELKKRNDNQKEYFALYFSGPIRSAGTTATCIFVAVADYVRVKMGYAPYDPTEHEIKRTFSELEYFHERIANLQYFPSERETEFLTSHLPLQIDGDASEKIEVPNYKDLPRVSTNMLRNGFCLVNAEGLAQKFAKFWGKFSKWHKEFGMDHWNFLDDYVKLQKEIKAHGAIKKDASVKIAPDYTYIKDIVGGRPILGHPLQRGSFRLRYGRTRTSGFSSDAIHPATMIVTNNYLAIGTQLKTERPGKSTTLTTCDRIEGPIVKLKDQSVRYIDTVEDAQKYVKDIVEIIYLGDILINYGDFLDRGHILAPPGYCEEYWVRELEAKLTLEERVPYAPMIRDPTRFIPSCEDALALSQKYSIPLHPRYTYHWMDITFEHLTSFLPWLRTGIRKEDKLIFPHTPTGDPAHSQKRTLELLGVPHSLVQNEYILIEGSWANAFCANTGITTTVPDYILDPSETNPLTFMNKYSLAVLKDKSGIFIGTRMGRPEKAKIRKMTGSPHGLFPVGDEGGRLRSFQSALEKGKITAQFPLLYCPTCNDYSVYHQCHRCATITVQHYSCKQCGIVKQPCAHTPVNYKELSIPIQEYMNDSLRKMRTNSLPALIKGVRGMSNKSHTPEHLMKGILRAKHTIAVNKDGTTRYDITEMALTHFKPKEIGTSIAKLRSLGYIKDIYGNELTHDDQVLELRCQDLILPGCQVSLEEGCDAILFRVANFIDELLVSLYGQEPYYNLKTKQDLVGHLVVGLSPHTSAGVVCRILGFSKTQGMHAHPLLHSIMRRDADGDEAGVMLLLDALLNFSKELLSDHRGATQDEPLVLTTTLIPSEVDDMVFNMDITDHYPLAFYQACEQYKMPAEIPIEILRQHLGTPRQYEGMKYTHETDDINVGVLCSGYKTIPTMEEKVMGQMELAEKIRAVNTSDVARLVIERHFLRDIKGNLRKYSTQQFRCVDCNEKFRRPPLKGICTSCSGRLLFTISEGSVIKYMQPCLSLAAKYDLPRYIIQTLELTQQRIEMVFGKDPEKQEGLGRWFGI